MGYKKITQLPTITTGITSTDKLVIVNGGVTYKTTVNNLIPIGTSGTSGLGGSNGTAGTSGTSGQNGLTGTSGTSGLSTLINVLEFSFQTTNSSDHQVLYDYGGTDFNKGSLYEVIIFASNASNNDLWSEKRMTLIGGEYNVLPTIVKNNDVIGTVYKDATLIGATLTPIVNTFDAGIYNIVWMANGINGTTINWKVQIKSIYL